VLGECRRAAPPSLIATQHQNCEAGPHALADGFKQFEGRYWVELSPKAATYVGGPGGLVV
jgi:hypothetical protein